MNEKTLRCRLRQLKRLWALRILHKLVLDAGTESERLERLHSSAREVLRDRRQAPLRLRIEQALQRAEAMAAALDPVRLPPLRDLASTFGLSADESRMLAVAAFSQADDTLAELGSIEFRYRPQSPQAAAQFATDALGLQRRRAQRALARRGTLARSGLLRLEPGRYNSAAVERFELADGLVDYLALGRIDLDGVLGRFFQRQTDSHLTLADYPQLASALPRLRDYLISSASQRAAGANILLYGPPGTGKSELARVLAAAAGLAGFSVRTADDDGDPIDGYERLRAFELAQRALRDRRGAMLIFDEVEDVFRCGERQQERRSVAYKGWLNERLERNPVPTLWICNHVEALEPAQLRRFDIVLEVPTPTRATRRRLIEHYLAPFDLDSTLRDAWAEHSALTPALLARAARVIERCKPSGRAAVTETARESINELLRLDRHPALPAPRHHSEFRLDLLNPDAALDPIVEFVLRSGSGRLCLYGPPGTGKSAFAEHLARLLDRPALKKRASDLLSPFVGVAERNIADAFTEARRENAVLMLDEADSFLLSRQNAQRSWEISQVNELLTQLEAFDGVIVASSNLFDLIDPAALRRFDYKLRFGYLRPGQRHTLFQRQAECWGVPLRLSPAERQRRLDRLDALTPGDFAAIERRLQALAGQLDDAAMLDALEAELRLKPEARRRAIGFAA